MQYQICQICAIYFTVQYSVYLCVIYNYCIQCNPNFKSETIVCPGWNVFDISKYYTCLIWFVKGMYSTLRHKKLSHPGHTSSDLSAQDKTILYVLNIWTLASSMKPYVMMFRISFKMVLCRNKSFFLRVSWALMKCSQEFELSRSITRSNFKRHGVHTVTSLSDLWLRGQRSNWKQC